MRFPWFSRTSIALAFLLAAVVPASSQSPTGTLAGRVTMKSDGSPIHAARILVVATRWGATTSDDGRFTIADLPVGRYEVLAQREHLTAARVPVTISAGETTTVDFALALEAIHEEVAVTASASGTATAFDSFSAVSSLDSVELALGRGASLASALAGQPGVALRTFGAGNARPVIRGFDGDRVLVMQDGMRTGDLSSQSGDHGVAIDAASLERIEVVKGPATLLYGSNAIGGVVNAITPQDAFRTAPFEGVLGALSVDAASTNAQAGGTASIQVGRRGWTYWGSGGSRRTGNYDTPEGVVPNSGTTLTTGRAGFGWLGAKAFASVTGGVERHRYGVPFADAFHAHDEEEGATDGFDVDVQSQRRELRFDGGLRQVRRAFVENIKSTLAVSRYDHDEIEIAGGAETIGTQLRNDTTSLRSEIEQRRVGRVTGRLGGEWLTRQYRATGEEALAPPTDQSSVAAFIYEEVDFGRTRLQMGGRLERTAYTPGERAEGADEGHEAHEHEAPPVRARQFVGGSASFGVHRDLGSAHAVVVNASLASRAPALEELYNFGPHVGNLAFEIGNPDLALERTRGVDFSLRHRSARASAELSVYRYHIDNFVFLDVTDEVVDGLRESLFVQGNSRFTGLEVSSDVKLAGGVHVDIGASLVRARLADSNESLPRIPAAAGRIRVEVPWRQLTVMPELVLTARQGRVFRDETQTAGSALVHLSATYFLVRGHATHAVTFKAHNLANTTYRLHTSFLKDLAPEMGRGITATYTVRFF